MTPEKIHAACASLEMMVRSSYPHIKPARHADDTYLNPGNMPQGYAHLLWMLTQIPHHLENGRHAKAERWVCFIQGVLWGNSDATISELKDMNR